MSRTSLEQAVAFAENPELRCPCVLLWIRRHAIACALWSFVSMIAGCAEATRAPPSPPAAELKEETNSIDMKLLLIPAGKFMMGCSDGTDNEKPVHRVRITRPFYIGTYEVTVGQYRKFADETKRANQEWKAAFSSQTDDHPVVDVSWEDADAFCKWLSAKEGKTYRLPTEAEWEYACRAGTTTGYCFGDDAARLGEYAWFFSNSGSQTHAVGQNKPNAWGLYDMHGNAREWCADWSGDLAASPSDDPVGRSSGNARALRGGSWDGGTALARSAYRDSTHPAHRNETDGFRVARTP